MVQIKIQLECVCVSVCVRPNNFICKRNQVSIWCLFRTICRVKCATDKVSRTTKSSLDFFELQIQKCLKFDFSFSSTFNGHTPLSVAVYFD